jgi:hypothetical protein
MARTISFTDVMAANEVVQQNPDLNNSEFNPLAQTSRVTLFATGNLAPVAGRGLMVTLKLGTDVQCTDFVIPQAAGLVLSTRDHQVATGVAARGSKLSLYYRNEGTALPTLSAYVVIEPL